MGRTRGRARQVGFFIVAKYPTVDVERMFVQPSRLYHAMKVAGIAAPYPSPVTVEDTGVPAGADGAH